MDVIAHALAWLWQDDGSGGSAAGAAGGMLAMLIWLAILVLVIAGMWKVFVKAGQPGWAVLVPIYNLYVLLQIAGRPGWWLILMIIPFINAIVAIVVCIDIAKKFGKSVLYGLGLAFLGAIFFPMLGFSDAQYQG